MKRYIVFVALVMILVIAGTVIILNRDRVAEMSFSKPEKFGQGSGFHIVPETIGGVKSSRTGGVVVPVDTTDTIVVAILADINEGEIEYEVEDPNGNVVMKDTVSTEGYLVKKEFDTTSGRWEYTVHMTSDDRGKFKMVVRNPGLEIMDNNEK